MRELTTPGHRRLLAHRTFIAGPALDRDLRWKNRRYSHLKVELAHPIPQPERPGRRAAGLAPDANALTGRPPRPHPKRFHA